MSFCPEIGGDLLLRGALCGIAARKPSAFDILAGLKVLLLPWP